MIDRAMLADLRANLHVFQSGGRSYVLVSDGSRIYDVPPVDATAMVDALSRLDPSDGVSGTLVDVAALLLPADRPRRISAVPLTPPPLQSLSLNVAQACNMSCGYCYADDGKFGGKARMMGIETARASVDRLLAESEPGTDVVLGFIGGEPMLNRSLVHAITNYASVAALAANRRIRFSITTNATLLNAEDARLFSRFPFSVTVSIDGPAATHRRLRVMRDRSDAYERLCAGVEVFASHGRPRHLSARVTVTPFTGDLLPVLDHVIAMGFDEVGFAPVITSPVPELAFSEPQFEAFLSRIIACGEQALRKLLDGQRYPFGNFEVAMHQIHKGVHRPYPCGAAAGYLSAGADGDLFACHRLIDDDAFHMGDVVTGSDRGKRAEHLRTAHVDTIEPCRTCWARYLCGGGCYHEVSRRGRIACDYIRGWLDFCLRAYVQLAGQRPEYFDDPTVSTMDPGTSEWRPA